MALSTLAKEQENFLRYAILIVDHTKEALQDLIELNLKNKHLTFEEFLNKNKHEIYHLCDDFRCCQCLTPPRKRKRIIFPPQLELLFDKYNKLPSHKGTGHNDFCCSYAKVGITSQVLDLSLARCLLVNCCLDVFWFTCLTAQGQTLEQFLNSNKHVIYHLWKNNQKCCQCPPGFIFPRDVSIITENEWRDMFNSVLLPCFDDRKRTLTETTSVCSVAARPGIDVKDIHPEIQGLILKWCCPVSDSVEKLVEFRNINFGHVTNAKLSDANFNDFFKKTEEWILTIACICGKELEVKNVINHLRYRPLDARLCSHYQNILLENINRNETISQNVILEHQKTREEVSSTLSKFEERIKAVVMSSIEVEAKVQGLRKLITDNSKRSQLLHQTSAEIEFHERNDKYLEVGAVRHCVELLESRNVVVLSGRKGSGKSSNGLEILRQIKGKNNDSEIFKLIGLNYLSDIVKDNMTSIVLFDDAFEKTSKQFYDDKHILDHLYSYIDRHKIKLIFTMRNSVKHACQQLITTHILFQDLFDIDLNSETFQLTKVEKEKMLINYCDMNNIMISVGREDDTDQLVSYRQQRDDNEPNRSVPDQAAVILERETMKEIIETDPFLGFPECCRIFTENRNRTHLDVSCFKWPSAALVNEVEKFRMEGKDNYINGLKYVTLIHILGSYDYCTNICTLAKTNINAEACKHIYNVCYDMIVEVSTSDVEHVCKLLTGRYLLYQDQEYLFQHKAIQDSVLISYSKIDPTAIIPLLTLDLMVDIVRLQNYLEQEDEIVIKIPKAYYNKLAEKVIVNIIEKCFHDYNNLERLLESKIMTENDVDLIYHLIVCRHNVMNIFSYFLNSQMSSYINDYFPLYLLRNIGKLKDNMLKVNYTSEKMLITVILGDKHLNFFVDPEISLTVHMAQLKTKSKDIPKWLLENSKHSLIHFDHILFESCFDSENLQFILSNVKHDMIDMTQLFTNVCLTCHNENSLHTVEWMIDNVDNTLINFNECINDISVNNSFKHYDHVLLRILKKVNSSRLNIKQFKKACIEHRCNTILKWVLQNFDHEIFEKEELINFTIDNYKKQTEHQNGFGDNLPVNLWGYEETVEIILLLKPVMKCCQIKILYDFAIRRKWYGVLQLVLNCDIDRSIDKDKIIDDLFQLGYMKEQYIYEDEYEEDEYEEYFYEYGPFKKYVQFIRKHYLKKIDIDKVIKKACKDGVHTVVEGLILDNVDDIPYYLDFTLNNLRFQQLEHSFNVFKRDYGKILLLFLKRVNNSSIDLNSVMNNVCQIGFSSVVLWLLQKNNSHRFDMRNVMNKACYHCHLNLVRYLFKNYGADDFDYCTAMTKACRNSRKDTLNLCKWLWENIDHNVFDMKAALNNACKYGKNEIVKWIIEAVDIGHFDAEAALLCACEYRTHDDSGLFITELLYERADKSTIDINAVFSAACNNYRSDIVHWIIETCDQTITVTETSERIMNLIYSSEKCLVDMNKAINCIIDMEFPEHKKKSEDKIKHDLLYSILTLSDLRTIHVNIIFIESCKKKWLEIFRYILAKVNYLCLDIREAINIACQFGAFNIVKWSLNYFDPYFFNVENVMAKSCAYAWLECLVLIQKRCYQYISGNNVIVDWLLDNVNNHCFQLPLLLQEAGRNGWMIFMCCLVNTFQFHKSDLNVATNEALANGHLSIVEWMISVLGRECIDISSVADKIYLDSRNEAVVTFIFQHFDPRVLDIASVFTNACKFGWKNTTSFILDNDLSILCDFNLAFNIACDNGEREIVKLLLEKVDHQILDVNDAMLSVAVKGWDEIAILLLEKIEHTRLDIGNALIEARRHGQIDVVQAILQKIENNMLDIEAALDLDNACENHMHEKLVL